MYHFESYTPGGIPQKETVFDQLSPRLSTAWRPDPATSAYASVGRGFEVPAINELSGSPGDAFFLSRPKSLWNYEVGGRRIVGGRVLLDGSIFYADVRGEFVPRTVNNVALPENASRSRNIGVELGVTARATPHVELAATYTFLDLRLQDYSSVSSTPPERLRRLISPASSFRRCRGTGSPVRPAFVRWTAWTSACRSNGRASCT